MIIDCAILYKGKIYSGEKRHYRIIHNICKELNIKSVIGGEQGFLDDKGRFLRRTPAKNHAFKCGQITKTISNTLTSEDLW